MKMFRAFLRFVPRPGILAAIIMVVSSAYAQDDVPMRAMKDELMRSISQLQLQEMDKPYFIAYRMDDMNNQKVSATLGSLTQQEPSHVRLIGVELRVGSYDLDNSNYVSLRDLSGGMSGMFSGIRQAPLDDNYQQIRRSFWLATDGRYKKALEDLSAKRAALAMRQHGDEVPDFSKETPATKSAPQEKAEPGQDLKALARDISAVFKNTPEITNSAVEFEFHNFYTRYVNSEGSSFTRGRSLFKFQINAQTQSADGQPISDSIEFYGRERADLPDTAALVDRARTMADHILKLRSAATLESYNGPVLFEGASAGEAFTQQFATGLLVVRTPSSDDARFEAFFNQMMSRLGGTSLVDKIGGHVLPEFLSVADHPESADYKGAKLLGSNQIDDDAVPTRETLLVDHGVLKTLLSTRVPVRNVRQSTGSRRGWGAAPSNLFVTSDKAMTSDALHKELLRRAKERGLDYGIVVRRIGGGAAASFVKMAVAMGQQDNQGTTSIAEIYKLYADGHEELVRGMEISEMPASAFKDIVAAGDTPAVFTDEFIPRVGALFSIGASTGPDMPIISCVSPSILFEELSLNKTQGPFPNPPVSPSPLAKQ